MKQSISQSKSHQAHAGHLRNKRSSTSGVLTKDSLAYKAFCIFASFALALALVPSLAFSARAYADPADDAAAQTEQVETLDTTETTGDIVTEEASSDGSTTSPKTAESTALSTSSSDEPSVETTSENSQQNTKVDDASDATQAGDAITLSDNIRLNGTLATNEAGTLESDAENDGNPVRIVETGETYATIQDAIDAASNDQTIQLVSDHSEQGIVVGKYLTLDLNGKTLSTNQGAATGFDVRSVSLTIKNGTIHSTGYASSAYVISIQGGGQVTLGEGATILSENSTAVYVSYGGNPPSRFILDGGTITLGESNGWFGVYTYYEYACFEMRSGKIENLNTGSGNPIVQLYGSVDDRITGGEIISRSSASTIRVGYATLYVSGDDTVIKNYGAGKAIELVEYSESRIHYYGSGNAVIDGGYISGSPSVANSVPELTLYPNSFTINGGFFSDTAGNSDRFNRPEGQLLMDDDNDGWYVLKTPVASITKDGSTKYYSTLQKAVDDTDSGDTIDLMADIELSEQIFVLGKHFTLNLGEHSITRSASFTARTGNALFCLAGTEENVEIKGSATASIHASDDSQAFYLVDSKLKISDVTVSADANNAIYAQLDTPGRAFVTVESGKVSSSEGDAIHMESGTLVVNGGEVSAPNGIAVKASNTASVQINGGEASAPNGIAVKTQGNATAQITSGVISGQTSVQNDGGTFEIEGGVFSDAAGNGDEFTRPSGQFLEKGKNESYPEMYALMDVGAHITVDGVTTYYESYSAAYDAAQPGQTIVLDKDVDNGSAVLYILKSITLDLYGHTITAATNRDTFAPTIQIGDKYNHNVNATITDSSPEKTGAVINTGSSNSNNIAIYPHYYSTVTIENVRVESTNASAVYVYGGVIIKEGALIKGHVNAIDLWEQGRLLRIEGGTIEGGSTISNATNVASGTVTITGGAFSDDLGNSDRITRPDDQILIKDEADGLYRLGKNVTVTFDANGGSGYMADVATNTLHAYVLPTCTFTPPNDSYFAGWKIDDTDTVYEEGAEVVLTGDTTVVAQWNTYHFDLYVQGIRVSRMNCQDVLGDLDGDAATVSYDIENNMLILDGANIEAGRMEDYAARYVYGYEYGIRANMGEDFKIELRGDNSIVNASLEEDTTNAVYGISYIWNSKGLITGTGTLSIDFDSADSGLPHAGIQDMAYQGGGVTIDGATVDISITGSSEANGIWKTSDAGTIDIKNGAALKIETLANEANSTAIKYAGSGTGSLNVSEDSTLELISAGRILTSMAATDATKALGAVVNKDVASGATADGARKWDGGEDYSAYKYMRIPDDLADKDALIAAIEAATQDKADTPISADGKELAPGTKYTSTEDAQTLQGAIDAAQAIVDKEKATQDEVDAATAAMTAAQQAFDDAKQTASVDKTALEQAIADAQAAEAGVATSEDGKDLAPGTRYITAAEKQALDDAIATAQAVVDKADATQNEVDAAKAAMDAAKATYQAAIKEATVSKDALNTAIEAASQDKADTPVSADGKDLAPGTSYATPENAQTLQDAIDAAQAIANKTDATQNEVDVAEVAMKAAQQTFDDAKQTAGVDKTALEQAIADAQAAEDGVVTSEDGKELTPGTRYTTAAEKQALDEAIDAAQAIANKADATQNEVDAAKVAMDAAKATYQAAIKEAAANKDALNAAIAAATQDKADTPVSTDGKELAPGTAYASSEAAQALQDAIDAAQAVANKTDATQNEVDAAAAAIEAAKQTFDDVKQTAGVDKTALVQAIDAATQDKTDTPVSADGKELTPGTKYTSSENAQALQDAIDAAQAIVDKADATQNEVDAAETAMKAAQQAFDDAKQTASADKTALVQAIEAATQDKADTPISADGKELAPGTAYTSSEAAQALQDAIDAAQAVADKADATQNEVDAAKAAIEAAKQTFDNAKQTAGADKTALAQAIADAQAAEEGVKTSTDGKDIDEKDVWTTPEERKALDDAIAAAQAVADNPQATQNDVDAAAEAVQAATNAFNEAKKSGTRAVAYNVQKDVYYSSLGKAHDDAEPGQTIQMLDDIDFGDGVFFAGKKFTLDLNGHTLSSSNGATGSSNGGTVWIGNSGDLTVKDSSATDTELGTGKIVNTSNANGCKAIFVPSYKKFTLESGSIECENGYAIYHYMTSTTIYGGSVSGKYGVYATYGGTATIEGGQISGTVASVASYNGTTFNINGGYYSDDVGNGDQFNRPVGKVLVPAAAPHEGMWELRASLASFGVEAEDGCFTGQPVPAKVTTTPPAGVDPIVEGEDYEVQYLVDDEWTTTAPTEVGTYSIKLVGLEGSDYEGSESAVVPYEIVLAYIKVTEASDLTYTGAEQEPELTVIYTNTDIPAPADSYTVVSYAVDTEVADNNAKLGESGLPLNAGFYTVTISANEGYDALDPADLTLKFEVAPADISEAVIGGLADQNYTGQEVKPGLTVTLEPFGELDAKTDYDAVYSDNVKVGTASVYAQGKGNFCGQTQTGTFKIEGTSITDASVKLYTDETREVEVDDTTYTYDGQAKEPYVVVTMTINGEEVELTEDDFTALYFNNVKDGTAAVFVVGEGGFSSGKVVPFTINPAEGKEPSIVYRAGVEGSTSWGEWKEDGATAGTVGKGLRLEGLQIKLENRPYEGDIVYEAQLQSEGWKQGEVMNGETAGHEPQKSGGLRVEAVKINLTGEMAEHYDVWYHLQVQRFGWMGWAKNGEVSGTVGYSFRVEALEIVLLPKGSDAPTTGSKVATDEINMLSFVRARSYDNKVWQGAKGEGDVSGTRKQVKRQVAVGLAASSFSAAGLNKGNAYISVRVYQLDKNGKNGAWSKWSSADDAYVGNANGGAITGFQAKIAGTNLGDLAKYDLYYRVEVKDGNGSKACWLGWAKNDEIAGQSNVNLEQIEFSLVPKGEPAPPTKASEVQDTNAHAKQRWVIERWPCDWTKPAYRF